MSLLHRPYAVCIILLVSKVTIASHDTIGPNGINSEDLELTGEGVSIGQVEIERPGTRMALELL